MPVGSVLVMTPAVTVDGLLAAVPDALRPYVAGSYYGESGVDVELTTGIELRFGDASRVDEKWRSAVAVLAAAALPWLPMTTSGSA